MLAHSSLLFSLLLAQSDPVPPQRAAALMKAPAGFRVSLVASEPDLLNPMAMTTDDRGRLWVVESHSYPHWIKDGKPGKDRVLIFDDPKHDGQFDKGKVFLDGGTNVTSVAVGLGGVWVLAPPKLLFIPMKPGDDRPAGPAQVVLDGWSLDIRHNVVNSLTWGPDGWLWGLHGILATSKVGAPGAPPEQRTPINCGVWRYHPYKKKFEVVASGTTNPWGLDFDEEGEAFITNCVIKHIFHAIPGAHFTRMYGEDLNPHVYGLMESCADHLHWAGGNWTTSRGGQGAHGDAGGGHAHSGCMIYLGDAWPKEYRNQAFICNLHGNRINRDPLERRGSGYVAKHGPDFLFANDPWFRALTILGGADGNVFVSDWHDTGECHNYDKTYPSGRIYKISHGKARRMEVNLGQLTDAELVKLQRHPNDWHARRARLVLQERAQGGSLDKKAKDWLLAELKQPASPAVQLRWLWTLHVCGLADEDLLLQLTQRPEEAVRRWAVRLLVDDKTISPKAAQRLATLAKGEPAAGVRLALASALQWLPLGQRWAIAENLVAHGGDAQDANIPLMLWYGIEPLAAADPARAVDLLGKSRIPLVRQNIARRLALLGS